jgi:hypothetical protein
MHKVEGVSGLAIQVIPPPPLLAFKLEFTLVFPSKGLPQPAEALLPQNATAIFCNNGRKYLYEVLKLVSQPPFLPPSPSTEFLNFKAIGCFIALAFVSLCKARGIKLQEIPHQGTLILILEPSLNPLWKEQFERILHASFAFGLPFALHFPASK